MRDCFHLRGFHFMTMSCIMYNIGLYRIGVRIKISEYVWYSRPEVVE